MMRLRAILAIAVGVLLGAVGPAGAKSIWDGDPWGPYGWDAANERFHQPRLATPIPDPPAPLGPYDDADFDGDGVKNSADNCLLVANADQAKAFKPTSRKARRAYRAALGPSDLIALADAWKADHPGARFRADAELGEACSGYNDNYLRTTRALVRSGNRRKLEIFRFLGQSGPMFGGAADPFPAGRPAGAPTLTKGAALPRGADGKLAKGNLAPSMPICSGYDQVMGFVRWLTATEGLSLIDQLVKPLEDGWERSEQTFGCNSDGGLALEAHAMHHFWAGKRLYTNADGGRITNRFVASMTEHPLFRAFVTTEPFKTLAKESGFVPYADDPDASGQSRHGIIFRGRSYIDGRDAIMMDWRGFEAAWPLGHGTWIHGALGLLIYDECRAIQTGVYHCTAVTDWVVGERRHTFQEGYMPWVLKGPPSIDEYVAATT